MEVVCLQRKGFDKMVYVLLADGFEEIEAITPIDIMCRADIEVKTVSIKSDSAVIGAHGIPVAADMIISDIDDINDMDLLMLPGGAGYELLNSSEEAHKLIDFAVENDIYVAAICAAPSILGRKGLLNGKRATCFPGFEKYLTGAEITGEKVTVDGKFITGKGAGAAAEFGFVICEILKNKEVSVSLRNAMQY